MLDPETTRERVTRLQWLRELTAERIEQKIADQERTLKLLEEKHLKTVERLFRRNLSYPSGNGRPENVRRWAS